MVLVQPMRQSGGVGSVSFKGIRAGYSSLWGKRRRPAGRAVGSGWQALPVRRHLLGCR